MGKTWEPGRERFCDANETLEYVESRSFGCVDDRFTVPSVRMGGRTERLFVEIMFCDDVGEDIMVDMEKDPGLSSG